MASPTFLPEWTAIYTAPAPVDWTCPVQSLQQFVEQCAHPPASCLSRSLLQHVTPEPQLISSSSTISQEMLEAQREKDSGERCAVRDPMASAPGLGLQNRQ